MHHLEKVFFVHTGRGLSTWLIKKKNPESPKPLLLTNVPILCGISEGMMRAQFVEILSGSFS